MPTQTTSAPFSPASFGSTSRSYAQQQLGVSTPRTVTTPSQLAGIVEHTQNHASLIEEMRSRQATIQSGNMAEATALSMQSFFEMVEWGTGFLKTIGGETFAKPLVSNYIENIRKL